MVICFFCYKAVSHQMKSLPYGGTIAKSREGSGASDQFNKPSSVVVNEDQTVSISDSENHRIIAWRKDASNIQVVAAGDGRRNRSDQ